MLDNLKKYTIIVRRNYNSVITADLDPQNCLIVQVKY